MQRNLKIPVMQSNKSVHHPTKDQLAALAEAFSTYLHVVNDGFFEVSLPFVNQLNTQEPLYAKTCIYSKKYALLSNPLESSFGFAPLRDEDEGSLFALPPPGWARASDVAVRGGQHPRYLSFETGACPLSDLGRERLPCLKNAPGSSCRPCFLRPCHI